MFTSSGYFRIFVTKMCPKYLLTRYYKCLSQYQMLIKIDLANSNNIQYYQVYTVYANTNMAGTRIACPIYTVNLGGARSDIVAYWLARRTLKPADQDRFLGWHLSNIGVFSSFLAL